MSNKHETPLKLWLERLIYAALKDVRANWLRPAALPSEITHQSYENLCKDKESQLKVKNVFTISAEVPQHLASILGRAIGELETLTDEQFGDNLKEEIAEVQEDGSYLEWIIDYGADGKSHFGETLRGASEPNRGTHSRLMGEIMLDGKPRDIQVITKFYSLIEMCFKTIAMRFAKTAIYTRANLDSDQFCAILLNGNMPQFMIDDIQADVRIKTTPKKTARAKKTSPEKSEATSPVGETASLAGEEATSPVGEEAEE